MCTNAYFLLQSIRKIRRYLTMESCKILVHSLVTSRLDCANILLCNVPDRVTARLERVQRSSARLIYRIHHYQLMSITALLHELHWLPVVIRIQYKVLVTVFKACHSGTPQSHLYCMNCSYPIACYEMPIIAVYYFRVPSNS